MRTFFLTKFYTIVLLVFFVSSASNAIYISKIPINEEIQQDQESKDLVSDKSKCDTTSNHDDDDYEIKESQTHELQELVVKGENAYFDGEKYTFIPNKSEKNLANSAITLIENMKTGILYVENGEIKSHVAGDVNIFINGVHADEMDLSNFWPQNALRVEYFISSTDPKFQGKTNIVNFIMKEYSFGGITKIDANQEIPNNGRYDVSSMLNYKRMTYNLLLQGGYDRDHFSGSENTETYDDVWYNGEHYNEILRKEDARNISKADNLFAGFNARYRDEKITATHTAKLQWHNNPGNLLYGTTSYTPNIISSDFLKSETKSKSLSPNITGIYNFIINPKWSINASWNFKLSHNQNLYSYQECENSEIVNNSSENTYSIIGMLNGQFRPNAKMAYGLYFNALGRWFDTEYTGDTSSIQKLRKEYYQFIASWTYNISRKVFFSLYAQVVNDSWKVNSNSRWSDLTWGLQAYLNVNFNRKNSGRVSFGMSPSSPPNSTRNDLIIRQTELNWLQGNPEIKIPMNTYASIGYSSMPNDWFNLILGADFRTTSNGTMIRYASGGQEYDGIIGTYENSGRSSNFNSFVTPAFILLNRKIRINLELDYNYSKYSKLPEHISNFRFRPSISGTFGNHMIWISYLDPIKNFLNGGTQIEKSQCDYSIDYTYGSGNLYLSVRFKNIFRKHDKIRITEQNGPYQTQTINWTRGRYIDITLTYTFDYGKKNIPDVESIDTSDLRESSVLGR